MDRLILKRGLVALGGLALVLAASGCRDRNLRVPPPAHYSDGAAIPEAAVPGAASSLTDPATMDPYAGISYGSAGAYDPAATPAAGAYDPAASSYGSYDSYGGGASASGASYGYDPAAGQGMPSGRQPPPVATIPPLTAGRSPRRPHRRPSATRVPPALATDPYAGLAPAEAREAGMGMPGASGTPTDAAPAALPGLDGASAVPPIPDTLPDMP